MFYSPSSVSKALSTMLDTSLLCPGVPCCCCCCCLRCQAVTAHHRVGDTSRATILSPSLSKPMSPFLEGKSPDPQHWRSFCIPATLSPGLGTSLVHEPSGRLALSHRLGYSCGLWSSVGLGASHELWSSPGFSSLPDAFLENENKLIIVISRCIGKAQQMRTYSWVGHISSPTTERRLV